MLKHWTTAVMALAVATLTSGCGSPLTYDLGAPAEILTPISHAGITDGRVRYREIFCGLLAEGVVSGQATPDCDTWLHRLGDESQQRRETRSQPVELPLELMRVFIVPGYLGDAAPGNMMPWGASFETLKADGFSLAYVPISGGGSASHNARQIADFLEAQQVTEEERVVLIGYSKGIIDALHFLVDFPEMVDRVDAVVAIAGAVNGSPLADEIPDKLARSISKMGGGEVGDAGGLESLRRSVQMNWLARNPLPSRPQYFSLAAFTERKNVSTILTGTYDRLALVEPLNDSQVIFYDQIIPGSTLLGYANGDHWAVALPFQEQAKTYAATLMDRNAFPRTELLEAVLLFVKESLERSP